MYVNVLKQETTAILRGLEQNDDNPAWFGQIDDNPVVDWTRLYLCGLDETYLCGLIRSNGKTWQTSEMNAMFRFKWNK